MSNIKSIFKHFINTTLTLLVILVPFVFDAQQAMASENAWYAGVAYGRVIVDRNVEDFDDGSITSGRVDDKDSGWKVLMGYRYNRYLAVEFGRAELNNDLDNATTFTGQSNGSGNRYAAGKVTVDIRNPIAYYLAVEGRLPLAFGPPPYDNRLALYGKLGVTTWSATESITDSNGRSENQKDGTDFMEGFGVEYKWPTGITLKSGIEYYREIVGEQYELHLMELTYDF